jgi:membrane peptidoglycan carboxypeptidase
VAKRKSFWKKFFTITLICGLSLLLILFVGFVCLWNSENLDTDILISIARPMSITAENGEDIDGSKTQKYCKLEDISQDCQDAFIAVEDKNFYNHNGLSYPRIVKAAFNNLRAGYSKEGASTITQQLIKNTHLTHEKTVQRKLREAILSVKLEQKYSKDEILEMYLNAIYFGNNIYGIANASEYYFNKPPIELTAGESAGLASIIQSPVYYDPIINYDNFERRTKLILSLMREQGYLTEEEYQAAVKDKITVTHNDALNIGSAYQTAVLDEAKQILNLSDADIASYGFKIETYYDKNTQLILYKNMCEPEYAIKNTRGTDADKFIIYGKVTGEITALWASLPTLVTARRNFGSALKPLLVYAPAVELGTVSAASKIDDSPLIDSEFNPKNVDGKYHGEVTVRESLVESYNIPAVKIIDAAGIDRCCEIGTKLGLTLKNENLSAALGNTTNGISFGELMGGYQTLANHGRSTKPRLIKTIKDKNGKIIYKDPSYNYSPQVINEDTAYIITDMLCDVSRKGTGKKLSSLKMQIASKTGTAQRTEANTNTDAAFVSYTPENVMIAWAGNADMKPENDLPKGTVGGGRLGFIVRDIYKQMLRGEQKKFDMPRSVVENNGEYYCARYANRQIAENTPTIIVPIIDGQINGYGKGEIWFDTFPTQIYEIYKNDVLQEVVKSHDSKYLFEDKFLTNENVYKVNTKLNQEESISNEIKLYIPKKETATVNRVKSKKPAWYFN